MNTETNAASQPTSNSLTDFYGPMIYAYTRADAIADGVLVDLSALYPDAVRAYFKLPMAMNVSVYTLLETHVNNNFPSNFEAVLNVMLWMFHSKTDDVQGDRVFIKFAFRTGPTERTVTDLVLLCGPGDDGEPTLTICEPRDI